MLLLENNILTWKMQKWIIWPAVFNKTFGKREKNYRFFMSNKKIITFLFRMKKHLAWGENIPPLPSLKVKRSVLYSNLVWWKDSVVLVFFLLMFMRFYLIIMTINILVQIRFVSWQTSPTHTSDWTQLVGDPQSQN